ncbi:MAG: pyridoxal-5'-phosphate-dependent protein subunit beta [Myxococcales bacterium]|nr:pyridoxal-5'-phosphate-dependent protein subunit beta [Myxococcales bacterium]
MARLGLEREIVNSKVYGNTVGWFREAKITLPTFAELATPSTIPAAVREALTGIEPDAAHPLNLYRVHWYNAADRRGLAAVPQHFVVPSSVTGVRAKIVVALGRHFPMIEAHKVLAAYACLAPRVVTGQFDPTTDRALWPSTGNYCRGGVAISRIMRCRGVAILPAEMSRERFDWLERWVADPSDVVKTVGSESNVKEIYDKCAELDRDPHNVIFNQFCEFANHLAHYQVTGRALGHVFESLKAKEPGLRLRGFVSATGSAGTIAAGDYLKDTYGSRTVAVEALECPTMLTNGFGAHNIQGIGDKHIPYIHNVMNTDDATAVSDKATDALGVLFSHPAGREYLRTRRGVSDADLDQLGALGFSGICNVLAAIKAARYHDLGEDDVIVTVATDGAAMYGSERDKILKERFGGSLDLVGAAEVFGQHMAATTVDHFAELSHVDRTRIFNLGYFTWVEQQGVSLAEFEARRDQRYWRKLREVVPVWDAMIAEFNQKVAGD